MGRIKGEGRVYRLKSNEHYREDYTTYTETIHWPALDWHPEFRKLDKRKTELLESDEESAFIHRDEVTKMLKSEREETQSEYRDMVIRNMHDMGMSQTKIADVVDLSQGRISQLLRGD